MYRVDIGSFNHLVDKLRSKLVTKYIDSAVNSCGSDVRGEVRLSMALQYLAGGSVWDIQSNFIVSMEEFYRLVWRTIDAINGHFKVELDITDNDELRMREIGLS